MCRRPTLAVLLFLAWGLPVGAQEPPDFDTHVAPLLAAHCLDCHSGAEPQGGLDLSRSERVAQGGESGAALTAGAPEESLLWQRVAADEMPPKKPLAEAEKKLLHAWLQAGAKWGANPIDPYRATTAQRAGYDWWSLQPVQRPHLPPVPPGALVHNEIDRFIVAKLAGQGLQASPPADRATLLRRLTFDLTGLPPTPEEVSRFENDRSAEAYARVVDRLLESPHYGERWARHWLDVAHFGESDGFEYDRMRPNAWPYRDWVIDAFNRDLPYDEFVRLQIAGDVLRPEDPAALTAAGFLVHGAHDSLMPAGETMRQIMRQDELEDVVGLVSQTFLGLTVHCARCHDHKFDPILAHDYYRLASSLAGVRRAERTLPPQPVPAELEQQRAELRRQLNQLEEGARERLLVARGEKESRPVPPQAVLRWEFATPSPSSSADEGEPALQLIGNATRGERGLAVDGEQAYAASLPLETDVHEKTLEAWVQLSNLEQQGGGVISLQALDGSAFDAIVFGEREKGQWMAGSEGFQRTQSFQAPPETEANQEAVHMAIVYSADGTITAYRNGEVYGKPYKANGLATFKAGQAQVVLGLRHAPPGGNRMLAGRIARAALYDRALTAEEVACSAGAMTTKQLVAALRPEEVIRREQLLAKLQTLDDTLNRLRNPRLFTIQPQPPEGATHLLLRGNPLQKAEVVSPAGLSALKLDSLTYQLAPMSPEGERRRRLAEWITHRDNPLFARTIANRVWHYHFGRGLVETPNDLGFNGGLPSHPELLDLLASELASNGWSLKHLHRLIAMSATYQQASLPREECLQVDRNNRLLWRYAPRRLEAEAVRDAMLSVAGELNPQMGGPSFQDFRPYVNHNAQYYEPIDPIGAAFNRRSVYRMWARGGKSPLLDTFDCPDPSTSTPSRGSTTTPLQALALLNNGFTLRMADHMAARLTREVGGEVPSQIERAFQLAYARLPTADERRVATAFVARHGLAPFCRVLLNTNAFLYVN
jgi:hypothetical protein